MGKNLIKTLALAGLILTSEGVFADECKEYNEGILKFRECENIKRNVNPIKYCKDKNLDFWWGVFYNKKENKIKFIYDTVKENPENGDKEDMNLFILKLKNDSRDWIFYDVDGSIRPIEDFF